MALAPRQLGLVDYASTFAAMQDFTAARDAGTPDALWICEHSSVFTQGLAGKKDHLLNPGNIAVVQSDRGGQVTYHGPGHLVMYPIVALRENGISLRAHIRALEAALIAACAAFGIAAERRDGAPGCWVGERKIGAVGVRVERGVAWHGLALNVGRDLAPFDLINPCGHAGVVSTSIALEQDWAATARGERNLIGAAAPDLRSVADLVAAAYESELAAYGTGASVHVNSAVPAAAGGSR